MKTILILGKSEEEAEKDLFQFFDGPFVKLEEFTLNDRQAFKYSSGDPF